MGAGAPRSRPSQGVTHASWVPRREQHVHAHLIPGESCATELPRSCTAGRGPGAAFPAWPRASRQLCCCCCSGSSALAPLQQDSALSWGTLGEMNLSVACAVLHVVWASSNQSCATQQWFRFQLSPSFGLKEFVDFSLPWKKSVSELKSWNILLPNQYKCAYL